MKTATTTHLGPGTSRRDFLHKSGLLAAALALAQAPGSRWISTALASEPDPCPDTFNGLLAFVVPGNDPFSTQQGLSTPEPGGVGANVTLILIGALDQLVPFPPNFSGIVAGALNGVAQAVHPGITGPFASPFANLSFGEKAVVFQLMEGGQIDPTLVPLASALLQFVGFLAYSEAGAIDFSTGTLTGTPLGWTLTGYKGVTDGTDEFKGYYQNRRNAE